MTCIDGRGASSESRFPGRICVSRLRVVVHPGFHDKNLLIVLNGRRSGWRSGTLSAAESRRLAVSAVGVLLSKSVHLSNDVHLAMQSRGFRGEVHVLPDFRARASDWCWLAGFVFLAAAALWWGR